MSSYIDGFVLPIPKNHLKEYQKIAEKVSAVWKEHGALEYYEYVLDQNLDGTVSFEKMTNAKSDEAVIFGWVLFDSLETRNVANEKVISDPRMNDLVGPLTDPNRLIFDAGRMVFGGFKSFVPR